MIPSPESIRENHAASLHNGKEIFGIEYVEPDTPDLGEIEMYRIIGPKVDDKKTLSEWYDNVLYFDDFINRTLFELTDLEWLRGSKKIKNYNLLHWQKNYKQVLTQSP